MKYGMPTLVECRDIYECCETAERFGLDFVEINMSFPQYLPEAIGTEELKRLGKKHGLFFTIHADEQMNPFDFNPRVSACYFEVMRDTLRFARATKIPTVNMHLLKGVYVTLPDRVVLLPDIYREEYLTRVREFISMCEEEIGDSHVRVAIENVDTNPFTESQTEALALFMESPVFALTLDTGHEDCLGYSDSHVFEKYPDRLLHLHLHDSNGKKCHLPLGTGRVDIREKLSRLKSENCLIEVKTVEGLRESIIYLKENSLL